MKEKKKSNRIILKPKKPNGFSETKGLFLKPKKPDNDNEDDNDNDYDYDYDIESIYQSSQEEGKDDKIDDVMDETDEIEFEKIIEKCELHVLSANLAMEIKAIVKEMYIADTREKIRQLDVKKILYALKKFSKANTKSKIHKPKQYFEKCILSALEQTELSEQYDVQTISEMESG